MVEHSISEKRSRLRKRLTLFTWALIGAWTLAVALSILWDETQREGALTDIAEATAQANFERDTAFQEWNAEVGGVYVMSDRVSGSSPLLPEFHPIDQIVSQEGNVFTRVPPTAMTRQVDELAKKRDFQSGRIILRHPLRAENIPGPWELEALRRIGGGEKEVSGITETNGEEYFNVMRPLIAENSCTECHDKPEFQDGKIEGGATQSIRMAPLRAAMSKAQAKTMAGHGAHWFIGMVIVVFGHRRLSSEIKRRESAEARISHLAHHDELTGLPNRNLFFDRLERSIARSNRSGFRTALLFIDLDGFKPINDSLGHKAGDLALKEVSRRLLDCVRETDTVARIGGDEFAVLLSDIPDIDVAARIASQMLEGLSSPLQLAQDNVTVGASIGISFYPDNAEGSEELLHAADAAMYEVKNLGKNGFSFASCSIGTFTPERQNREERKKKRPRPEDLSNELAP